MALPSLAVLLRRARKYRQQAEDAADEINLATFESYTEKHAMAYNRTGSKRLSLLADVAPYHDVPCIKGKKA